MRRFVIGDIHGCAKALRTVIEKIDPTPADEIVFLGDYIDRGIDSRNVVDQVIELQSRCNVVSLCGNHELMLLAITGRSIDDALWLASGGRATVTSYGGRLAKIPDTHLEFFSRLRPYYESQDTICVHAGYDPELAMSRQEDAVIHWNHLPATLPAPHLSGKRVVIGHTPQPFGNVLDGGHVVCIDTYCFGGGYLTALDLDTDRVVQADHHGHLRRESALVLSTQLRRLQSRFAAYAHRKLDKAREANEALQKSETSPELRSSRT